MWRDLVKAVMLLAAGSAVQVYAKIWLYNWRARRLKIAERLRVAETCQREERILNSESFDD